MNTFNFKTFWNLSTLQNEKTYTEYQEYEATGMGYEKIFCLN